MTMLPPSPRQGGFTLLEVLVALVLTGMLIALLFRDLQVTAHMRAVGGARGDRIIQVTTFHEGVRALLEQARAIRIRPAAPGVAAASGTPPVLFDGAPDRLIFVAPMPARVGLGGTHLFDLESKRSGASWKLVLHWRLYRAEAGGGWDGDSVLLDGLRSVHFFYYGSDGPKLPPRWHDRWDGRPALPLLVKIAAAFDDGTALPDLIAAPKLANADLSP